MVSAVSAVPAVSAVSAVPQEIGLVELLKFKSAIFQSKVNYELGGA